MSTAPFSPEWAGRLPGALTVVSSVTLTAPGLDAPLTLDVITGSVTFDEDTAPQCEARLEVRIPADMDTLDLIDPRRGARLVISTGYKVPGRPPETHVLADLLLVERPVKRSSNVNVMTVRGVSDEQLVMDYRALTESVPFGPASDGGQAIATLITTAVPDAIVVVGLAGTFVSASDTLLVDREDDWWGSIQDIADRIGAWVYHDSIGTYYVVPQVETAAEASAVLAVGPGGTLTGTEATISRDEFANAVVVHYSWYDGDQRDAWGWAEVTAGPFGSDSVGRKVKVVSIDRQGSAEQAAAAAASIVRRTITRGRRLSLEMEHAPFWLRPGQTVAVQLVTGPQERHLVSRVDFDLPGGTGHVTTRQPEDVTIISGG